MSKASIFSICLLSLDKDSINSKVGIADPKLPRIEIATCCIRKTAGAILELEAKKIERTATALEASLVVN